MLGWLRKTYYHIEVLVAYIIAFVIVFVGAPLYLGPPHNTLFTMLIILIPVYIIAPIGLFRRDG
jgi:hypothetical protein